MNIDTSKLQNCLSALLSNLAIVYKTGWRIRQLGGSINLKAELKFTFADFLMFNFIANFGTKS